MSDEEAVQRWCYKASFEAMPRLCALLAELGIEWSMIDAYSPTASVLLETAHEVESSWRPAGGGYLERCWTETTDGGPCLIVVQRVLIEDPDMFDRLLGTRDPPP